MVGDAVTFFDTSPDPVLLLPPPLPQFTEFGITGDDKALTIEGEGGTITGVGG
jgi:hypothetical protein